jgi:hypothetical protein
VARRVHGGLGGGNLTGVPHPIGTEGDEPSADAASPLPSLAW